MMTEREIMRFSRRGLGFERRTIYAKNQIRFFIWMNKFYYRKNNNP